MESEMQMLNFQIISKNSEITFYEKKIEVLTRRVKELESPCDPLHATSHASVDSTSASCSQSGSV